MVGLDVKYVAFILICLCCRSLHAQSFQVKKIETGQEVSFRGLSVVDSNIAWASGNKGCIGLTTDGGVTWKFSQIKNFTEADFRSVYAFDRLNAIVVNAGSPATVLRTEDGGQNWKTVYTNAHKDVFVDGIDFWNDRRGIIYGDPIDGRMFMLQTKDGGLSWVPVENAPHLESGEASFAASGTGIRCVGKSYVFICTGGMLSRLWFSNDKGEHWTNVRPPIIQGEQTTGIFSFAKNHDRWIVVGGDYKNETQRVKHVFYSDDAGRSWLEPSLSTNGYRECVEVSGKHTLLAIGPSGLDSSHDSGMTWQPVSNVKGFHVIRKARKGRLIVAAGGKGQIALITAAKSKR